MAQYPAIRKEAQDRHNKLFDECGVFWAFSNEQFDEGRPKDKSIKLVSIGAGGFMPKDNFDKLIAGSKAITKWEKDAIKAAKADEQVILYELNNHEAFYTLDTEDAFEALKPLGYTREQVKAVYKKYNTPKYRLATFGE